VKAFDAMKVELGGKNLVEASAGTGKTYAITTLFSRFLLDGLEPRDILVVTFTDAATAELRDRVRGRLVELTAKATGGERERLERALENIDEAPISTIHGFCQRVLSDNAFGTRVPFDAELVPDLSDLHDDALYDFWQARVAYGPPWLARQLAEMKIDVGVLRKLLEEARRNPRVSVLPPEAPLPDPSEVTAAFDAARAALSGFDLEGFMETHGNKGKLGGAEPRARLRRSATACLQATERAAPWVPANANLLFPSHVRGMRGDTDHPFFAAFERLTRLCWQGVLSVQHEALTRVPKDLHARKARQGVLGFDDLLLSVADALGAEGGKELAETLRRRFKAVLIDEFQDTDPVQFEIFDGVFGGGDHPLFLIGDPKQAIYGFRGADVYAYLSAARGARRHSMKTSYRSDPGLVAAVNALFRAPGVFEVDGIDYVELGPKPDATDRVETPMEVLFLERDDDSKQLNKSEARRAVARATAADIVALVEDSEWNAGQVAVLTRTNAQCFLMQDALRERGIHSVVISDTSVFESDEAQDVQAVLGAALDPLSRSDLRRAVATSLVGVTGDEIAAHEEDAVFWQRWVEKFRTLSQLWVERGFVRMFRALLAETNAAKNLLERPGGERRLTNVLHLSELLHRASVEQHLGPASLLTWLAEQREGLRATAERAEIRLESDEAAVKILTVHKAKGLEFPVVYCPFLWDSGGGGGAAAVRFHDDKRRAFLDIEVDPEAHERSTSRAKQESKAEEIRVAYVALTRAAHKTTIVWGGFNKMEEAPAAKLLFSTCDKSFDDAALRAALHPVLCVRSQPIDHDRAARALDSGRKSALSALEIERRIVAWKRTGSFSGLVRHEHELDPEEGRDHDEIAEEAEAPRPRAEAVERSRITLFGFPRGRRTGNLFHDVFEHTDFATVTEPELAETTARKLEAYGLDAALAPTMARAVRETLDTELAPNLRLADVGLSARLSELEFRLPVLHPLTKKNLASVFRKHPVAALGSDYAGRVERLDFRDLEGFLKGYVDLIFEHAGRWYVVDYKTNHLGDHLDEYGPRALGREMAESHYVLQYHLYTLALHRYLGHWQKGYDYERHFGGVYYLFIKGMRPGATTGVFFEKPPLARLDALSEVIS